MFEYTIDPKAANQLTYDSMIALLTCVGWIQGLDDDISTGNGGIVDTTINITHIHSTDVLAHDDIADVIADLCFNVVTVGWVWGLSLIRHGIA